MSHQLVFQIRKTTAKKLFEAVITVDDVLDAEYLDEGMAILSDTDWSVDSQLI